MYRVAACGLMSDMYRIFLKTHAGQHESKRDTARVLGTVPVYRDNLYHISPIFNAGFTGREGVFPLCSKVKHHMQPL